MALYHVGSEIEIVGDCGTVSHTIKYGNQKDTKVSVHLIQVKFLDNGTAEYTYAENLRAEGGMPEIEAAVKAAPKLSLKAAAKKVALAEAG